MKKRVFVAIALPPEVREAIGKVSKELEGKHWAVKWEPERKLHITLAFLGKVELERMHEIILAVVRAAQETQVFDLGFKGLGCFPNLLWPKVIWVGLRGDLQALARLSKRIVNQLDEAGFAMEQRPFEPHVTLGRISKDTRLVHREDVGRQIKKMLILDVPVRMRVEQAVVYESTLAQEGSDYEKIAVVKLPITN